MALKSRKLDMAREQVLTAYRNGVSLEEISKLHKVSKGTVRNMVISEGEVLRKRGRPKSAGGAKPVVVEENE